MPKFTLRTLDDYPVSTVRLLRDDDVVVEITRPASYAGRSEIIAPHEYDGPGGGWSEEEIEAMGEMTPAFDNDR